MSKQTRAINKSEVYSHYLGLLFCRILALAAHWGWEVGGRARMPFKNKGIGEGKKQHVAHWEANWTLKVGVIQRAASGQFLRVSLAVILFSVPVLTAQSTVHSGAGVSSPASHKFARITLVKQERSTRRQLAAVRKERKEKHPGDGKEKVM